MKKIVAVFSVICMVVGLITMPAGAAGISQELCNETYETTTSLDLTCTNSDCQDESVIINVDSSNPIYYGLGNKVADFRSDANQWHGLYTTFNQSESIKSGENEKDGYTVEMAFDLCPAENGSKVRVLAEGSNGFDTGNNVMGIEFTADNTIRYYGRNNKTVVAEKALNGLLKKSALGAEHFYRIRIIFYVNNNSGSPYCDVYVDGVKVFENQEYAQNAKQRYIAGIVLGASVASESVVSVGKLDNLYVASYDADAKADFDLGLPRDLLLGSIRTAALLTNNEELADTAKTTLNAAIETAISQYSAVDSATLAEAATNLNNAIDVAEKSLSGSDNTESDTPQDGFTYIVDNDYESSAKTPFADSEGTTVEDDTAFIGKAWKLSDSVSLTSDVFEGVNILNSSTEPRGTDSILEFDIKFENLCEAGSSFALTQLYDQTPDGTQIAVLSFQKGSVKKLDGSSGTYSAIGTNVFEDGIWYRVRIVQHAVNSDGTFPQDMSLYIDGEPIAEHFARRSRTYKTTYFNQMKLAGLGDDVSAYIDNLKIYKISDSTENPPLNLGKILKTVRQMQMFLNTAVVGDNLGEYNIEDYNEVKTAYESALAKIPEMTTQTEVDAKVTELNTLYQGVKPNRGKVTVESITYSATDLKTANSINADIVVGTSRMADQTNQILALSVLYRNSKDYPNGEMLQISSNTATLGKKETTTLKTGLDLSAYTENERESLYIKTYVLTGEDRTTEILADGAVLGDINSDDTVNDELYGESVDIFKKELADKTIYFSISTAVKKEDRVLIFATKEGNDTNFDLTDIEGDNAKDKLEYFNISDVNTDGKGSFAFKPDTEENYRVVVYSQLDGKICDRSCIYINGEELSQTLADLRSGAVKIADVNEQLDLDTELFDKCNASGINMNDITKEIFEDNDSADVYEFKTQYLKNMNLMYTIQKAEDLDTVTKILTEYGYQKSIGDYDWNKICEYVYKNKTKVKSLKALETLLEYKPEESSGGVGSSPNRGTGGRSGGGYAATATVDQSKIEAKTPYEENASIFSDISGVLWAEEAIIFLAKNNMINGKSEGIFAPDDAITREEFAKIVVNMFGSGKETEISLFTDVDKNSWYYPYVARAYADGIVKGVTDNIFGVGMQISREDAIVMLYRAGNLTNVTYSDKAEYIPFEDGCSAYAQEAVEALAKSGIITGTGNNILNAGRTLTRAEAAKMIYELYSFINQNTTD